MYAFNWNFVFNAIINMIGLKLTILFIVLLSVFVVFLSFFPSFPDLIWTKNFFYYSTLYSLWAYLLFTFLTYFLVVALGFTIYIFNLLSLCIST